MTLLENFGSDVRYFTHLLHYQKIRSILSLPSSEQLEAAREWGHQEAEVTNLFKEWEKVNEIALKEQDSARLPPSSHISSHGNTSKAKSLPVDETGQVILPVFLGRSNIRVSILSIG